MKESTVPAKPLQNVSCCLPPGSPKPPALIEVSENDIKVINMHSPVPSFKASSRLLRSSRDPPCVLNSVIYIQGLLSPRRPVPSESSDNPKGPSGSLISRPTNLRGTIFMQMVKSAYLTLCPSRVYYKDVIDP